MGSQMSQHKRLATGESFETGSSAAGVVKNMKKGGSVKKPIVNKDEDNDGMYCGGKMKKGGKVKKGGKK